MSALGAGTWRGGSDALVCVDVGCDAPDVKTFWFAAASGAPFAFRPGQFLSLQLPLAEGPVWRCFTIASPPTRPRLIGLTIKRQGHGGATHWLHETLQPGMRLTAQAPMGNFALDAPPSRPLLLISAGSGATPMAAIARWLQDLRLRTAVHYLHVGRRHADLLFRTEIDRIGADLGGWRLTWLATEDAGRPTAGGLRTLCPDLGEAEVFCCGPAGFMAMVRSAFVAAGGPLEFYHEESFATPAPALENADPGAGFDVRFEPSGVVAVAGRGEHLLAVAARAKQSIPHACEQGICGSCRVRKISGEVEMNHQGGITEDEIADGDILACCSRALSPLVLELP